MLYTCLYHIVGWDGIGSYEDRGLLYVRNFTDAVCQIEDFYGKDLTTIRHIQLFDTPIARFDEDMFNKLQKQFEEYEEDA